MRMNAFYSSSINRKNSSHDLRNNSLSAVRALKTRPHPASRARQIRNPIRCCHAGENPASVKMMADSTRSFRLKDARFLVLPTGWNSCLTGKLSLVV
jgi:hypothetical protein